MKTWWIVSVDNHGGIELRFDDGDGGIPVIELSALKPLVDALKELEEWSTGNHEMPEYSEAIANAREALATIPAEILAGLK